MQKLPIRLTHKDRENPVLMLGDLDVTPYVAAEGLHIEYATLGGFPVPVVTLKFGPGLITLDFDIDLLERLLAEARRGAGE